MTIRRALISVSDKTGIVDFARALHQLGIEIISTGGTARQLRESGIPVIMISDVTGFPEILDGRVKTLHPRIHGAILAVRDREEHLQQLAEHQISPIDLVVVNLYPFQQTWQQGASHEEIIENIDIGGPTLIRASAKNYRYVTVVVDPADYAQVLEEIHQNKGTSEELRKTLASKAFAHTAQYDAIISRYFQEQNDQPFPDKLTLTFEKVQSLRYGENPHQRASFYRDPLSTTVGIVTAKQLHGKELSYNNIQDGEAAWQAVCEFAEPAVVVVKHTNPCGVGLGQTIAEAFARAHEADPVSIFGGIVAANRPIDRDTALQMKPIFLEIVLAPDFTDEALEILKVKKNLRLLKMKAMNKTNPQFKVTSVSGGLLVQEADLIEMNPAEWKVVTERKPSKEEWEQLKFAWQVVKHVKSNAIVLAKAFRTVGIGAGQMNRVGAAEIAIRQAKEEAKGSVLASDAFFPMKDTVETAAEAGITAIIQPGGSIRDEESIQEANRRGIAMVFTGIRHFKH
jgi:phosphoribosylaminoimidazolecarboxamide formyltransferase/IMP cyclohydrolase